MSVDGEETQTPAWERLKLVAQSLVDAVPHAQALGLRITDIQRGKAWGVAPFKPEFVGDPDTQVIAGGVITAMLDNLCGVAAIAALETPTTTATLDLRIDYMRPAAAGADILAMAHCHRVTRTVAFVSAVAYDRVPEDPVAQATAAFMLGTQSARSRKRP